MSIVGGSVKCRCGKTYTDAEFRAAHTGQHVELALKLAKQQGVTLVNCPACPPPKIAITRPH